MLEPYPGGAEWQVAGDVLCVVTYDDQLRTSLTRLALPSGRVLRQRLTARSTTWSLRDATQS